MQAMAIDYDQYSATLVPATLSIDAARRNGDLSLFVLLKQKPF